MSKTFPTTGDTVTVTMTGVVAATYLHDHAFEIGSRWSNRITVDAPHVKSVEIIKPPIKVGDVIDGGRLAELPFSSVVRHRGGMVYTVRTAGPSGSLWVSGLEGGTPIKDYATTSNFTVLYLPDADSKG